MFSSPSGKSTSSKLEHEENALLKVFTEEGTLIFFILSHPIKQLFGIYVKLFGKITSCKLPHRLKQLSPNSTTDSGKSIFSKLEDSKQLSPNDVTEFGISIVLTPDL